MVADRGSAFIRKAPWGGGRGGVAFHATCCAILASFPICNTLHIASSRGLTRVLTLCICQDSTYNEQHAKLKMLLSIR